MRYEMKDILKTMIDNNEPHWSADTLDMVRAELEHVYARADENEAKAEAFDHIESLVRTELTSDDLYIDARSNDYAAGMLRVYERVDYIIEELESGGSDD